MEAPVRSQEETAATVPLVEEPPAAGRAQAGSAHRAAVAPKPKATEEVDDRVSLVIENHLRWLLTGGKDGARADFEDADLHGANLAGVNLSSANLRGVVLADADFSGANLAGADLRRGDLSSAVVKEADLGVARLRHGTLRFTQLEGANLRETDLSRSVGLAQAQIDRAVLDHTTRLPRGLRLPKRDD